MNVRVLFAAGAAAFMMACAPAARDAEAPAPAETAAPDVSQLPAGEYRLEKAHASLVFRVSHLGFSNYTASFSDFDAQMQLDPANPTAATLTARVNPRSLTLINAPSGFREELLGPSWLDAGQYPEMSFRSTAIEMIDADSARITGDFTMHGQTRPVTLEATFNGGYAGHPMDPNARIGFSATGVLKRSEFGIATGIPAPGSSMGVSDDVTFAIEAEFTGPAWTQPAPEAP